MVKKQYSTKSKKKTKKKQVLPKTVIADTKVCSDCKASFIPDDELSDVENANTCAECLNKQKGDYHGK